MLQYPWMAVKIDPDLPTLAYKSPPRVGNVSVSIKFADQTSMVDPYILICCGFFRSNVAVSVSKDEQAVYTPMTNCLIFRLLVSFNWIIS